MKNLALVFLGVVIGLLITYLLCTNCMLPFECCSNGGTTPPDVVVEVPAPNGGDTIEYKNVGTYRNNYLTQFLATPQTGIYGCEGGRISIAAMTNIINSARPGDEYIFFKLGYDSTTVVTHDGSTFGSKMFTMFSIGNMATPTSPYPVYRNSGQSFCPTSCD